MPILFLLLLLLCAVSLSLDKAAEGLAFLFRPDFSKITAGPCSPQWGWRSSNCRWKWAR